MKQNYQNGMCQKFNTNYDSELKSTSIQQQTKRTKVDVQRTNSKRGWMSKLAALVLAVGMVGCAVATTQEPCAWTGEPCELYPNGISGPKASGDIASCMLGASAPETTCAPMNVNGKNEFCCPKQ